ncbi:MAG: DNA polymerase, partial [Myxococcota bacterium]
TYKEVCGSGKKQIGFDAVDVARATDYAAEDADAALRLADLLLPRVVEEKLDGLLRDLEIPLARVLGIMELHGIRLDVAHLRALGADVGRRLQALEREIHQMAGYPVNVGSPQQLQELLFEKLALPKARKTKTGFSTDADVLEELAKLHPIPGKILEHRVLAKLMGTYIEALPAAVNPKTGRLHTSYNQAVAATGRLSASDPNVQNIPIRTELGREIRRAFVADPGCVLLSCDYSQIELRVLAHLSEDPALVDAFAKGQDIHARTACGIFGVASELVTSEMRRIAKSVVYGLAYGQTAFGLAQALGIAQTEAAATIDGFFRRHARLAEYLREIYWDKIVKLSS